MRFYIAASFENASMAIKLSNLLVRNGHELTYDWTTHGDVRYAGPRRMSEVAFNEYRTMRDAELVLVLLPAGSGTHAELGMAIATRTNKRIIVWSPDGEEFSFDNKTCIFYYHPSVERIACPPEILMELLETEGPNFDPGEFRR
ncbi:MAG: group-specific protein [Clostridia bacterium]|nr:group-specific protein [Clostridia bacterium]MBR6006791.1 group-specific protein [Clostridia bacterium]